MNGTSQKFGDVLHTKILPESVPFKIPAGFDPGLLDPSKPANFLSDDVKALLGIPLSHKPRMALGMLIYDSMRLITRATRASMRLRPESRHMHFLDMQLMMRSSLLT